MVAPKYKFYASAPAPSTIRETLDAIYDRYGIDLPLVDLFRWSDPNATPADNLTAAFHVGSATVDDVSQTITHSARVTRIGKFGSRRATNPCRANSSS
jgi:hypothetical protein